HCADASNPLHNDGCTHRRIAGSVHTGAIFVRPWTCPDRRYLSLGPPDLSRLVTGEPLRSPAGPRRGGTPGACERVGRGSSPCPAGGIPVGACSLGSAGANVTARADLSPGHRLGVIRAPVAVLRRSGETW